MSSSIYKEKNGSNNVAGGNKMDVDHSLGTLVAPKLSLATFQVALPKLSRMEKIKKKKIRFFISPMNANCWE